MAGDNDVLQRFLLPAAGVRGALVRLGASWHAAAARQAYPPALRILLGESLAAAALMTANIKFEGSLSLQLKGTAVPSLLFAECTDAGRLRGLARWDAAAAVPDSIDLGAQVGAVLAITIGSAEGQRYQGLVELAAPRLATVLEGYFERSEQLPARVQLAVAGDVAAGLLLQRMPGEGGHDGGDADGWNRVLQLAATLGDAELLATAPVTLLHRLFHEEAPQLFAPRALAFGCSCSRSRVADVLRSLGRAEVEAALDANHGEVEVVCEFCAARYVFDRVDAESLLSGALAGSPSVQ